MLEILIKILAFQLAIKVLKTKQKPNKKENLDIKSKRNLINPKKSPTIPIYRNHTI